MKNKYLNVLGIELDANGRVVLSDAQLQELEVSAIAETAGAGTNSGNCSGGTNDVCRNTTQCADSTNTTCTNGSYIYSCKDTREDEPPIG